ERVRARRRRRVPHLLGLRARLRRPLADVAVARPRAARTQRGRPVMAPAPRPLRAQLPVTPAPLWRDQLAPRTRSTPWPVPHGELATARATSTALFPARNAARMFE